MPDGGFEGSVPDGGGATTWLPLLEQLASLPWSSHWRITYVRLAWVTLPEAVWAAS